MATREEIKGLVLEIIKIIAPDSELDGLDPAKPLREQIELDSMDFLDIVMELRRRYKIEVPKEDYGKLASLDSAADYLLPHFI